MEVTIKITGETTIALDSWLDMVTDSKFIVTEDDINNALRKRIEDEPLCVYPDQYNILAVYKDSMHEERVYSLPVTHTSPVS